MGKWKDIIIAVDAGHGSNTPGKRTPSMAVDIDFDGDGVIDVRKGEAIREHIANVGVCVFLAKELERCGFKVFQSAWNDEDAKDDEDVDLTTRQERIRKAGCQYSVSIHFNAFGDGSSFNSAEGVGTYYHTRDDRVNDSFALATIVQKHLVGGTLQKNRGVNRGSFAMVNCMNLGTKASILVELAFMTNVKEAITMMGNARFWKECGIEICKGFCEYLKVDYVEEVKETKPEDKEKEPTKDNQGKDTPKAKLYIVQIGAYKNITRAQMNEDKAKQAGFRDAYIKQIRVDNMDLYAVQIGAFSLYENAKKLMSQALSKGFGAMIK